MGAGELSYVHGACETPLLSDTIGQRLDRTAETWPGRPALIDRGQGVRWNWTELREQVDRLAAGFHEADGRRWSARRLGLGGADGQGEDQQGQLGLHGQRTSTSKHPIFACRVEMGSTGAAAMLPCGASAVNEDRTG